LHHRTLVFVSRQTESRADRDQGSWFCESPLSSLNRGVGSRSHDDLPPRMAIHSMAGIPPTSYHASAANPIANHADSSNTYAWLRQPSRRFSRPGFPVVGLLPVCPSLSCDHAVLENRLRMGCSVWTAASSDRPARQERIRPDSDMATPITDTPFSETDGIVS